MSRRSKQNNQAREQTTSHAAGRRSFVKALAIPLVLAIAGLVALSLLPPNPAKTPPGQEPVPRAAERRTAPAPAGGTKTEAVGFEKLVGKWLRPDGNYILEIKNADANGKLEATYFNPQPIFVSKAEAFRDGDRLKAFIELRDTNYPGCTYDLTYDAPSDQLQGSYFQAALQQSFDVAFVRQ